MSQQEDIQDSADRAREGMNDLRDWADDLDRQDLLNWIETAIDLLEKVERELTS